MQTCTKIRSGNQTSGLLCPNHNTEFLPQSYSFNIQGELNDKEIRLGQEVLKRGVRWGLCVTLSIPSCISPWALGVRRLCP